MYSFSLPSLSFPFSSPTDSSPSPYVSRLRLFEGGQELGPAHSLHATIVKFGDGAFSDWNGTLLFSTSDNSDPSANGRSYRYMTTIFLTDWVAACMIVLAVLLCAPMAAAVWLRCTAAVVSMAPGARSSGLLYPKTGSGAALSYGFLFFSPAVLLFLIVGARTVPQTVVALGGNLPLTDRVAAFLKDPKPYSVIFIGDSRTYCDIHPEFLERLVPKMHGLNLSNFANWFPTQLGLARQIAGHIPPEASVVWTVGHRNFSGLGNGELAIQRIYPIGVADALRLTWWNSGSVPKGLLDNLYYYQWYLHGFVAARELRGRLDNALSRPLAVLDHSTGLSTTAPALSGARDSNLSDVVSTLVHDANNEPNVVQAGATFDSGRVTSIIRYFRRGGYYRTELDSDFFRKKQAEVAPGQLSDAEAASFKASPPARMEWDTFVAILDVFAENKVRLIVNEVEEAPYMYGHPLVRDKWRSMMREFAEPEVKRHGFSYIRTDLGQLSDDDYFDYNHMNSRGIAKYTPMLARRLNELSAER